MAGRTVQDEASRGRGSRLFGRQFFSRMAALGAASLLILFALQACGGEDEDQTPTAAPQAQTAAGDGTTAPAATRAVQTSPAARGASPAAGAASPAVRGASPVASPRTGAAASPVASPAASPPTGAAASPAAADAENGTPEP